MKYNINEDFLVFKPDNEHAFFYIKLISDKIEKFSLDTHKFIKLDNNEVLKPYYGNGFFEQAYVSPLLTLYIKHKKNKVELTSIDRGAFYKFLSNNTYFLLYNDKFFKIQSLKSLKKIFSNKKKEIKASYESYRKLYKNNNDLFMIKLITNIDIQYSIE